ncbi:MAG: hypothetical protein B6240_01810 [Desulfobacteraceae bacterium 4572_87]|nr:MAG: hypothetical protein B6240_01810 [Desulfobacteraceae bacterium 4572_87]
MSKPNHLGSILESIDELPPFPETARKILELSSDDDVNYKEITNVIKYDEAVTSNCLRLCNSSYYGLSVKTFTIDQAVIILGLKNIQMIALASSKVLSDYSKTQEGYCYSAGELWRHSVTTAIISQLLFKGEGHQEGSVLFTSALLHDIGKIVEHAELGGLIAENWKFPSILCKSIKNHHKSPDTFIPNIEAWVRLSNLVYHVYLANSVYSHHREIISRVKQSILFQFSLNQKDIEQLTTELPAELKKFESSLRLAL